MSSEKFKENIHIYLLIYTINRTIIIISTIPTAVVVIAHAFTFLLFSTSSDSYVDDVFPVDL
jgi:hypothetical protein